MSSRIKTILFSKIIKLILKGFFSVKLTFNFIIKKSDNSFPVELIKITFYK